MIGFLNISNLKPIYHAKNSIVLFILFQEISSNPQFVSDNFVIHNGRLGKSRLYSKEYIFLTINMTIFLDFININGGIFII